MKLRRKAYLRLNLMSLFFITVSFISVTLAWFAYSGLARVETEIGVKAWYIELEKDGKAVTNEIVISLSQISPNMKTVDEIVKIKNLGDSDAQVKYEIVSARILDEPEDNYVVDDTSVTSPYVEDVLSHEYPFHVNINLSKGYVISQGEESFFEVSISWPLDAGDDELDSSWGTRAYEFQQAEEEQQSQDPEYQIRPSIQIVISLVAEQYLEEDTTSDTHYDLGDIVLFDVVNNEVCPEIGGNCIQTYVMDANNKLGDQTITLLPNPIITYASGVYNDYNSLMATVTSGWTVSTRTLLVDDVLKIVSTDVMNSFLIREGLSDTIIGNLKYDNRMNTEITRAVTSEGYYRFVNERFGNFTSTNCYWTNSEYNGDNGFAVKKIDDDNSKIYNEAKTTSCNVIPIIIANKDNL